MKSWKIVVLTVVPTIVLGGGNAESQELISRIVAFKMYENPAFSQPTFALEFSIGSSYSGADVDYRNSRITTPTGKVFEYQTSELEADSFESIANETFGTWTIHEAFYDGSERDFNFTVAPFEYSQLNHAHPVIVSPLSHSNVPEDFVLQINRSDGSPSSGAHFDFDSADWRFDGHGIGSAGYFPINGTLLGQAPGSVDVTASYRTTAPTSIEVLDVKPTLLETRRFDYYVRSNTVSLRIVPEPSSIVLVSMSCFAALARRR